MCRWTERAPSEKRAAVFQGLKDTPQAIVNREERAVVVKSGFGPRVPWRLVELRRNRLLEAGQPLVPPLAVCQRAAIPFRLSLI